MKYNVFKTRKQSAKYQHFFYRENSVTDKRSCNAYHWNLYVLISAMNKYEQIQPILCETAEMSS